MYVKMWEHKIHAQGGERLMLRKSTNSYVLVPEIYRYMYMYMHMVERGQC